MNKIVIGLVFLCSCASLSEIPSKNEFYHRMSMKPMLNEIWINGRKATSLLNPFDVKIKAVVDCDEKQFDEAWKQWNIKPNAALIKTFASSSPHRTCSLEGWEVVE